MLHLTSYERMRRYLSTVAGTWLTDSKAQKQMIMGWISSTSKQIEEHLKRTLTYGSYTEYFDTLNESYVQLYVKAYPITTLTSVYLCSDGLWDGSETEVDDCFLNRGNNGVFLPASPAVLGYKTHRIIYTGGLAYSGVRSLFTLSSSSGTWTPNSFVYGGTSEAVGIIKSIVSTTLTVEVLYGVFIAGELLTEYLDEDCTSAGDASATLSVIAQQSLVEQYPDIVRAAEIQVRHYWKHKDDFDLSSTSKDGTNQKFSSNKRNALTDETMNFLEPYINRHI